MGFTKLDSRIVQSSIMMEDSDTFKAWIVFLASCGPDGIARVSPVYIKSICNFTIEKTLEIIKKLESPDSLSRSINDEGRRIERVDGGYRIINYLKYREFTYSDNPDAIRKRKKREEEKIGHVPDMSGHVPDTLLLSSSSESVLEKDHKKKPFQKPSVEDIKQYCKERSNNIDAEQFFNFYESKGWVVGKSPMKSWKAAIITWEKNNYNNPVPKQTNLFQKSESNSFNASTFYGN